MQGRIIRLISNQYQVLLGDNKIVDAIAKGKLRLKMAPKAGDIVKVEFVENKYVIADIKKRFNDLLRPPIANIDQMIIVMSAKRPDFSISLVDQLLIMSHYYNVKPVIVISKYDLLDDSKDIDEIVKMYKKSGYLVLTTGKNYDTKAIEEIISNKFSVLSGQSGVGKSTLLNRINPDFQIKTQEISDSLNRGKHTTRHVEFKLVKDGWVADTPGFSKIDLTVLSKYDVRDGIKEFDLYSDKCRFRDCLHINEPNCAVRVAVEEKLISEIRYNNYLKFQEEVMSERKKY